jgi:hypothetical protein
MPYLDQTRLILDILLLMAGLAAFSARPRIGGELAGGLRVLLAGVFVMGAAELLEVVMLAVLHVAPELIEVGDRLLLLLGFVLVIFGLATMRRAFEH